MNPGSTGRSGTATTAGPSSAGARRPGSEGSSDQMNRPPAFFYLLLLLLFVIENGCFIVVYRQQEGQLAQMQSCINDLQKAVAQLQVARLQARERPSSSDLDTFTTGETDLARFLAMLIVLDQDAAGRLTAEQARQIEQIATAFSKANTGETRPASKSLEALSARLGATLHPPQRAIEVQKKELIRFKTAEILNINHDRSAGPIEVLLDYLKQRETSP
jgi:hypothetical protein